MILQLKETLAAYDNAMEEFKKTDQYSRLPQEEEKEKKIKRVILVNKSVSTFIIIVQFRQDLTSKLHNYFA